MEWLFEGLIVNFAWIIIIYFFKAEKCVTNNNKNYHKIKNYFYTRLMILFSIAMLTPFIISNIIDGHYIPSILLITDFIIIAIQLINNLNELIENFCSIKKNFNKKQNSSKNKSKKT